MSTPGEALQTPQTGAELRVGIPAPIEEVRNIGGKALFGQVDPGNLVQQANANTLQPVGRGELTVMETPAPGGETVLREEVAPTAEQGRVESEVAALGAVGLNNQAPRGRFNSLAETATAYVASWGNPDVRVAAWDMYKANLLATHRAGVNALLVAAKVVPGVSKGVQLAAKPFERIYTPNAKVGPGLKTTLKVAEKVGVTAPEHLAEGLSQAGHDFKRSFETATTFRETQAAAMRDHRAANRQRPIPQE